MESFHSQKFPNFFTQPRRHFTVDYITFYWFSQVYPDASWRDEKMLPDSRTKWRKEAKIQSARDKKGESDVHRGWRDVKNGNFSRHIILSSSRLAWLLHVREHEDEKNEMKMRKVKYKITCQHLTFEYESFDIVLCVPTRMRASCNILCTTIQSTKHGTLLRTTAIALSCSAEETTQFRRAEPTTESIFSLHFIYFSPGSVA